MLRDGCPHIFEGVDHMVNLRNAQDASAWFERTFRGKVPADLGELFEWSVRLGVHNLPIVQDRTDLLPEVEEPAG